MKSLASADSVQPGNHVWYWPGNAFDSACEGPTQRIQGSQQDLDHLGNLPVTPCNLYVDQVLDSVRHIHAHSNNKRERTSGPRIERRLVILVVINAKFLMRLNEPSPNLDGQRFWKLSNDVYNMSLKSSEDAVCRRKYRCPLRSGHLGCCQPKHLEPL